MTLARLQSAIASLACEPDALDAFTRRPEAWLDARGLSPRAREIVASIPHEDLQFFHEIVHRDRAGDLRAMFPLTIQFAGEALGVDAYIRACPYPSRTHREEGLRFAAFVEAAAPPGVRGLAARDLARLEAAKLSLFEAEPAVGETPGPDDDLALAPGQLVVDTRTNLADVVRRLEAGESPAPIERSGGALVRREPHGDPFAIDLTRAELRVLDALATPRARAEILAEAAREPGDEREAIEESLEELIRAGVVVRGPARRVSTETR